MRCTALNAEAAQDIPNLTGMRFSFSFEENLAKLIDEADPSFRNAGIEPDPVLPNWQSFLHETKKFGAASTNLAAGAMQTSDVRMPQSE